MIFNIPNSFGEDNDPPVSSRVREVFSDAARAAAAAARKAKGKGQSAGDSGGGGRSSGANSHEAVGSFAKNAQKSINKISKGEANFKVSFDKKGNLHLSGASIDALEGTSMHLQRQPNGNYHVASAEGGKYGLGPSDFSGRSRFSGATSLTPRQVKQTLAEFHGNWKRAMKQG